MLLQTREGESDGKQAAWGSQIECAVSAAEAVGFKPPRPLPPTLGSPVPVSALTYEKPQPGEAGRGSLRIGGGSQSYADAMVQ